MREQRLERRVVTARGTCRRVEDLHWADGKVVQLLDRLTLGAEMPLLAVATARPELAAQGGLRPGGDRFFLTLDALDAGTARALARHAGSADASGIERAEGNPLYVIELARARSLGIARDGYADRAAYARAVDTCRWALRFAGDPADVARVEQAIARACAAGGDADEAWAHYLRVRDVHRDAGTAPPADLYPSLLELPVYTSGMFRQVPADGVVEALLREGEDAARRARDDASLARLLALDAYRSHDPARLVEALRVSEGLSDPASLASCLAARSATACCRCGRASSVRAEATR